MRRLLAAALFALLCALAAPGPRAQEFTPAPGEAEMLALLDRDGKPVEAREAARAYLAAHPDSFVALMVCGVVSLEEDADLPRAYYFLKRARKVLDDAYPTLDETAPWRFYGRVLWALRITCQRMERYEEALDLMRDHDERFDPDRPAEYAWPLMKLGRTDDARAKIAEALTSPLEEEQLLAHNSLGALEAESDNPEEALAAFDKLYELQRQYDFMECTFIRNRAEGHLKLLQFDEAEKYYLEAARYFDPETESNPWQDLALLYLDEGRTAEAVDAVKRMQSWSFRSKPVIGLDNWNHRQTIVATLMLRLGYTEEALALARRAADRPDRHGYGSAMGEQWEASSLFFLREALLDAAARAEEAASFAPLSQRPGLALRWASLRLQAFAAERRAARLVMTNGWLADTLRVTGPRSTLAFPGGESGVCEAVGPGVAEAQVRRLLARTGPAAERERPMLEFLLGKSLLDGGDPEGALAAFARSEPALAREYGSAHAQLSAFRAQALRDLGDAGGYRKALAEVMEADGGLLRRCGLALPVVLEGRGGSLAMRAVEALARSPRLDPGSGGFRLVVTQTSAGALEGVLEGPDGAALARVRSAAGKDGDATLQEFCRTFHRKAFAPPVDLSQAEVNSLEGSTLAGEAARDALKGILGETPGQER